jgi:hypothetical protein
VDSFHRFALSVAAARVASRDVARSHGGNLPTSDARCNATIECFSHQIAETFANFDFRRGTSRLLRATADLVN